MESSNNVEEFYEKQNAMDASNNIMSDSNCGIDFQIEQKDTLKLQPKKVKNHRKRQIQHRYNTSATLMGQSIISGEKMINFPYQPPQNYAP